MDTFHAAMRSSSVSKHTKALLMIVGALVLAGSLSLIYALAETPSQAPAAVAPPITTISTTTPPDLTATEISFQGSDGRPSQTRG
jgi:hypothetical protein